MEVNVTAAETLLQVDDVRRILEEIFSGLERAMAVEVVPENECFLAANYSSGLELSGDAVRRIAGAQHHEGFPRRSNRSQQSPGEPAGKCQHRDEN